MRSIVPAALLLAALASAPAVAQRRPLPPTPRPAPSVSPWLTEPALLTAYVATVVPATLARATDDPTSALVLVGAGYALGPLAGWYVAGAPERGAAWTVVRAATYGGVLWSFAAADYAEAGPAALPAVLLHGVAATVVLAVPYAVDVGRLGRHVRAGQQERGLSVMPTYVGGALGVGASVRW